MKKIITSRAALVVAAFVLAGVLAVPALGSVVYAVDDNTTTVVGDSADGTSTTTDVSATTEETLEASMDATDTEQKVLSEEEKAQMAERVKSRISKYKVSLKWSERKELSERCTPAQNKISALQKKISAAKTDRPQTYGAFVDKLTTISEKIQAQGLDTTELDAATETLGTLIEDFKTEIAAYEAIVVDLVESDCAADPNGFQATLEDARTQLAVVRDAAAAIRDHVKNVIKPELQSLRQQLEQLSEGTDDSEEGTE